MNIRNQVNVSEAGDRIATGERLISAGAKLNDSDYLKRGVQLLKSVGYPKSLIIAITQYLVKDAKNEIQK